MPGLFAKMREQNPELAAQYEPHYTAPNHYQDYLREIILAEKPQVVVETGVLYGTSSDRILSALDTLDKGTLYSIDPNPPEGVFSIDHPRWVKFQYLSTVALTMTFGKGGPWDIFLHDSDHEVWCQTFEYEVAWYLVRPGGLIMSDDTSWGYPYPDHGAWDAFCDRHGLRARMYGSMGVVRKPMMVPGAPMHATMNEIIDGASALADRAARNYAYVKSRMTEVEPNLFVGTAVAAASLGPDVPPDWCVISVTEYRAKYGRGEELPDEPNGALEFPFMITGAADNGALDRMARVIDAQLKAGKKVLVHCVHAHERSPLAVAWYLAWTGRLTMEAAYRFVKARHPSTEDRLQWLNGLRPVR